jgi:hypothetical protein
VHRDDHRADQEGRCRHAGRSQLADTDFRSSERERSITISSGAVVNTIDAGDQGERDRRRYRDEHHGSSPRRPRPSSQSNSKRTNGSSRTRSTGGKGSPSSSDYSSDEDRERRRSNRNSRDDSGRQHSRRSTRNEGDLSPSPDRSNNRGHEDRHRRHPSKWMKPEKLDGGGSLEIFLYHFENCASYNCWADGDKVAHQRWSLTGRAAQLL